VGIKNDPHPGLPQRKLLGSNENFARYPQGLVWLGIFFGFVRRWADTGMRQKLTYLFDQVTGAVTVVVWMVEKFAGSVK